jgi:hypothetical protein
MEMMVRMRSRWPIQIAVLTAALACSKTDHAIHPIPDGPPPDGEILSCNVLTQTGCAAGQKCTWVTDSTSPPLGHIDCVPDGTVMVGSACTPGPVGPTTGYDNCKAGSYCESMVCKRICDPQGGTPTCPTNFACGVYSGLFSPVGQPAAAGVCDPTCNPLDDNKFGSGKTKLGSACSASQGCYGEPNGMSQTQYTCGGEFNNNLYHRAVCDHAADNPTNDPNKGCADASGNQYLNGCAQGFVPLLYTDDTKTSVSCISYCAPANCYAGHCGTADASLVGAAPHRCNATDSSGLFNVASPTNNGDQCAYMWIFEIDSTGKLIPSQYTDQIGFCYDHSKYHYDSNGDGTPDAELPECDKITTAGFGTGSAVGGTCTGSNGCLGAADFGCVDHVTAGQMFQGKRSARMELPRTPYHVAAMPKR